jgi:hypothetical protein
MPKSVRARSIRPFSHGRLRRSVVLTALAIWVWLASAAAPVRATAFCDIRKTRDGFVALRARPDAKAPLIARMHVGDEVLVRDDVAARGGFMFVTWWKGGRFKVKREVGYDPPDRDGWVHKALIADECG